MSALIDKLEAKGRFEKVPFSGCWIWLGAKTGKGYGSMSSGRYAHRVFYEETYGKVPPGKMVLHKCDVKFCVNPEHLFVGTHMDNVIDAIAKDRYFKETQITHCHRGHEFTEDNTYNYKGHRHCKACWKLKYKQST